MKRITVWLFALTIMVSVMGGCSAAGEPAPSGTLTEISEKIFAESKVENFGISLPIISEDDLEYFLGSRDYPVFEDALAVQPMINIDTRVMIIIKASNLGDVEMIKTQLKENIDPNKVVCVTFTLEDVAIESRGTVIFLTINTDAEQRNSMVAAFINIE